MDEMIVLTQAENFDIIGLNETWLDTEEKHLLAEVSMEGYKIFFVDKPTPAKRGGGSILYIKNALDPIERKATATRTAEIIQVDINPKNEAHIKIVLIYRNTTITAADDDMFYESLEEILLTQHECIIMGDFNLPNIDWTLGRPTPAPGSKLQQLVADNNLTLHVHEPTRLNNVLDLVMTTEEEIVSNVKIGDKIGDHQTVYFSIETEKESTALEKYNFNFRRANFYAC